jgi:DNA-binding beta-propeller fold protein YncE
VLSPDGRTLYVADANAPAPDGVVWPLDLATGRRGRAIRVTGAALRLAIMPDGRMLYSTDGSSITPITVMGGAARAPVRTGLTPGSLPILMSRDGRVLYLAGDDRIRTYRLTAGRFGTDIPARLPTAMVLSRDGTTLWYASYYNQLVEIRLSTGAAIKRVRLASEPVALTIAPDGRTVYAAVAGSRHPRRPAMVVPANVTTGAVGRGIPVRDPVALAIGPDGRTLYVLATPPGREGDGPTVRGWITPVDLAARATGHRIQVGYDPATIVITPNGKTIYVANEESNTISVIPARH